MHFACRCDQKPPCAFLGYAPEPCVTTIEMLSFISATELYCHSCTHIQCKHTSQYNSLTLFTWSTCAPLLISRAAVVTWPCLHATSRALSPHSFCINKHEVMLSWVATCNGIYMHAVMDVTSCLLRWGGPPLLHHVLGAAQQDQYYHGKWLCREDVGLSTFKS